MSPTACAPTYSPHRACTIVARNYLAQARVLARSFRQHHPNIPFYTVVIDGTESDLSAAGVGTVVLPEQLGIDAGIVHSMMVMYDVMEFATAVKPAALMWMLRQGSRSVAYFDPDIQVFTSLADVFETADERGILLTPHMLAPLPRDDMHLTEQTIMQAGMYNLGFIAVGASGMRFLSWWHERLQTDAIVGLEQALFTDQKWVDWAPSLFPCHISRDRGLNAAYWNLHDREVSRREDRWFADGDPLRFFHFSGYDPDLPWLLSKHMGPNPRILLSGRPDLRALCDQYRSQLVEMGHPTLRKSPYGLNKLPNGSYLAPELRRVYRDVLIGVLKVAEPPPDPIAQPDEFIAWFTEPMFRGAWESFSVAEYGLWHNRGDLRGQFPDVLGRHGRDYRRWLFSDSSARALMRRLGGKPVRPVGRYLPIPTGGSTPSSSGWSVVAYARSELGVGESGRRIAELIRLSGFATEVVDVPMANLSRQRHTNRSRVVRHAQFDNAVICVNADQVVELDAIMGLGQFGGRRVGVWYWELESFPERFAPAFDLLDEVWVASEFNRMAIQAETGKPVRVVPLPMDLPDRPTSFTRRSVGLPDDRFVFLANFDYLSVHQRKNPVGTIRAYTQAFGPEDGTTLVIKSINGHLKRLDSEEVRDAAHGRSDVVIVDDYVSAAAMKAMIELSDVYVSLHRSEGFGLNMADAMARSTPVIATGYSGNMDFMTRDTAALIDFDLVPVGRGCDPYDASALWADPNVESAAIAMRRWFDDPDQARECAERALQHVRSHFSAERTSRGMADLLTSSLLTSKVDS